MSTLYTISRDGQGMGGFMSPPGHPDLFYVVKGYYGGRRKAEADLYAGLSYLLDPENDDVPDSVRARAQAIMDGAQLVCSERWVRSVYGYFRSSYAPLDGSRNVSDAVSATKVHCVCGFESWTMKGLEYHLRQMGDAHHQVFPPLPPERHLGYLKVHDYFPEHTPRLDLIEDPGHGYGSYPCAKCEQLVQYEARYDALCVVSPGTTWRYNPNCPKGGQHLLAGETEVKETTA